MSNDFYFEPPDLKAFRERFEEALVRIGVTPHDPREPVRFENGDIRGAIAAQVHYTDGADETLTHVVACRVDISDIVPPWLTNMARNVPHSLSPVALWSAHPADPGETYRANCASAGIGVIEVGDAFEIKVLVEPGEYAIAEAVSRRAKDLRLSISTRSDLEIERIQSEYTVTSSVASKLENAGDYLDGYQPEAEGWRKWEQAWQDRVASAEQAADMGALEAIAQELQVDGGPE
jgi:hypothetical protein